jgi:aspartyl-tRNA(Asn)/glutamyl-tRNA(Gln) amidotransferase subunit B
VTPELELVVGLEVHCQLKTASKIFCSCSTEFGSAPNSNTCPVCLGLPGSLPVLNGHAVELATRAALAIECTVHTRSIFARKNYFYPDLPKGYQISQFDEPLATNGVIVVPSSMGGEARIRVTRVHMEEDAGKSVHDRFEGFTAVDLNRTGTPLIEIVSEPDIRSAKDAVSYLRVLKQILEYTQVSDANMEEGSLRVDVNISVRPGGSSSLGVKTEIKNLNTFSGVERAIDIEFARQRNVLGEGGTIEQQTMLWDAARNEIRPARSKEGSHDYRYFPDPDLPPLVIDAAFVQQQYSRLPELPQARHSRLRAEHQLTPTEADQVTSRAELATFFEDLARATGDARRAVNWVLGPVTASLNSGGLSIADYPVTISRLAELIRLDADGVVSNAAARQLLPLVESEQDVSPRALAEREGLLKVSDDAAIEGWIEQAMREHPDEAHRFMNGERKLQGVLVGFVMKLSSGSADPKKVNQLLVARLA